MLNPPAQKLKSAAPKQIFESKKKAEEVKKEIIKEKELALKSYQYKIDFLKNKH